MKTLVKTMDYSKTLELGKVDYTGNGRRENAVELRIELRQKDKGIELSICGDIWNRLKSDILCGGQIYGEVSRLFPNNKRVRRIIEVWKRWHLNGLRAGCEHQREEKWGLKELEVNGKKQLSNWVYEKDHPEGVLMKPCPQCGYQYGSAWLFEEIPQEIINEVKTW